MLGGIFFRKQSFEVLLLSSVDRLTTRVGLFWFVDPIFDTRGLDFLFFSIPKQRSANTVRKFFFFIHDEVAGSGRVIGHKKYRQETNVEICFLVSFSFRVVPSLRNAPLCKTKP